MNNNTTTISSDMFIKTKEEEIVFAAIWLKKFTNLKELANATDFKYYTALLDCYLEMEVSKNNSVILAQYPLEELNKIEADLANVILKIMVKNNIVKKIAE